MFETGIEKLLRAELEEQASWPREPLTAFRVWTGDPRNEGEGGGEGGGAGEGGEGEGGAGGEGGSGEGGAGAGVAGAGLEELFAGFRNDVLHRFDGIEQQLAPDEEEQAATPPPPPMFDPRSFGDDDYDDNGFLKPEAQSRAVQEEIERQVAQALAPERERAAEERRNANADALEVKHPIFADPEARKPIMHAAQQTSLKLARSLGSPQLKDLWRDPDFLETVYLGIVGQQAAEREAQGGGGGSGGVVLERGGSAGPTGSGGDGNKETAKRIAGLAKKEKYRLGS